jgi:hypothetical protein
MSVAISKYYEHLGDQLDGDAIELAMTVDDWENIRSTRLCPKPENRRAEATVRWTL